MTYLIDYRPGLFLLSMFLVFFGVNKFFKKSVRDFLLPDTRSTQWEDPRIQIETKPSQVSRNSVAFNVFVSSVAGHCDKLVKPGCLIEEAQLEKKGVQLERKEVQLERKEVQLERIREERGTIREERGTIREEKGTIREERGTIRED